MLEENKTRNPIMWIVIPFFEHAADLGDGPLIALPEKKVDHLQDSQPTLVHN
jgi:hypothetical protein